MEIHMLTQERLKELLEWNGVNFIWKISYKRKVCGKIAGLLCPDGYRRIRIDGKLYPEHRLVWFYYYGYFPSKQLDHINRNRSDNTLENLRLTQRGQADNMQNTSIRSDNTSGFKGVSWQKDRNLWMARIYFDGVCHNLGRYKTKEQAYQAYLDAKKKYHTFQPVEL